MHQFFTPSRDREVTRQKSSIRELIGGAEQKSEEFFDTESLVVFLLLSRSWVSIGSSSCPLTKILVSQGFCFSIKNGFSDKREREGKIFTIALRYPWRQAFAYFHSTIVYCSNGEKIFNEDRCVLIFSATPFWTLMRHRFSGKFRICEGW